MNRIQAVQFSKDTLVHYGLTDWHVKLTTDQNAGFLGLCDYKSKTIILSAHYIDMYSADETRNTILHEIAHALTPGNGHNDVWASMARQIGCDNTLPCSHLNLPDHVLDAIRSGQVVELEVEETTHVVRTPKFKVSRITDKCPYCGKDAVEKFAFESVDKEGNQVKMITLACFHVVKKIIPRATPFEFVVSNDWKDEIKNCKHDFDKNQCKVCGEYKLFNFQIEGARFAEHGLAIQKGAGIFDDMGLGKTVQALVIPKFHKEYTPFLVVTKSAITFQWLKQILRWLGPDYLSQIIKTSKDYLMPGLKSYIIPYDLLRRMDRAKLQKLGIKLVILDECQQIKNPDSARTKEVRELIRTPDCKVIPLSATPWKNRGSEFFPVLNMIDPIKFHSYQHFIDTWVDFYYQGKYRKQGGIRNIPRFKEYTKDIVIRREFNEVIEEFPDVNRMKLPVQMDAVQQSTYDDEVSEFVAWYNDYVLSGDEEKVDGLEILAKMARMRHITGLAKIPHTLTFIESFVEDTDRKLVIFVHHKDVGEIMYRNLITIDKESNPEWADLATDLRDKDIFVMKYTSELDDAARFAMQERFNKSKRAIMIASTLACGEGVDLQTCSDSILHERQWNPQNEEQATPGRFRRIGQLSKVINITVPEAEGSIDEHLDMLIETKRHQFHDVMNKSEMPTWNQSNLGKELAEMIVKRFNTTKKPTTKAGQILANAAR